MAKPTGKQVARSKEMRKRRQALTDPIRFQILGLLARSENGLTAKELAERIGKDTNRLYYHLRILEDAAMIGSNESRPAGRMAERVFVHKDGIRLTWDAQDPVEMSEYLRAQMEVARLDGERAIFEMAEEARGRKTTEMKVGWASNWFVLTHKDFDEYCDRLQALMREFHEREERLQGDEPSRHIEVFWLVSEHPVAAN